MLKNEIVRDEFLKKVSFEQPYGGDEIKVYNMGPVRNIVSAISIR